MTPERLNRIRALYEAAVDTPISVRAALLDRECNGDDALRYEVERLLGAREHLPDWLSGPVLGMAHAALSNGPSTLTQAGPAGRIQFPPGTVLAQRYRIIYLLGRGGMGEVYRADDLVLGQPVALKFLPAAGDTALTRFRNEVRTARQVSHPNVCRVYDIGEADGVTYLSMEYVDGEDLTSLLRRIGKLPQDKALEIARQLCAGLAAAHDKGVIHRDLKPANIMLDGRGQVRITDFGIAGVAAQIRDLRSGTPAYMSPEQLAGKEVTARSDIYALGIVLCEVLTGKRPPLKVTEPGATIVDSAVERVVQRCLDPNPQMRPSSALAVSAALPGGDPLAAALARGETPSPEIVAASQEREKEGLGPRLATMVFGGLLVSLMAFAWLSGQVNIMHYTPPENPPEALVYRARQVLKELGYSDQTGSTAYGFDQDWSYVRYLNRHYSRDRARLLATARPAVLSFWYRLSPHALRAESYPTLMSFGDTVTYDTPANTETGMIRLRLDTTGRLIALEARPLGTSKTSDRNSPTSTGDWSSIFHVAELDSARFAPAEPIIVPPSPFDSRAAWTGTFDQGRAEHVRLEAASWGGKPVYFQITGDWQNEPVNSKGTPGASLGVTFAMLLVIVVAGSAWLAILNIRRRRADIPGALLIGGTGFGFMLAGALLAAKHEASIREVSTLLKLLSWSAVFAGLLAGLYLATEPYVRRHWPNALISWSRFRAGQIRDILVASHVLTGISVIVAFDVVHFALITIAGRIIPAWETLPAVVEALNGNGSFLAMLSSQVAMGIFSCIALLLVVVLLRILIPRVWIADLLGLALFSTVVFLASENTWQRLIEGVIVVVFISIVIWLLRRFGLLAAMAGVISNQVLTEAAPLSLSSWYGGRTLVTLAVPTAVAAWGLWTVLSAHRGFRGRESS